MPLQPHRKGTAPHNQIQENAARIPIAQRSGFPVLDTAVQAMPGTDTGYATAPRLCQAMLGTAIAHAYCPTRPLGDVRY
eukprot:3119641-Rhodomonas_salina.2